MTWWSSMEVTYQLGIILGALIIMTVILGLFKVYINRRKLQFHQAKEDLEAAEKAKNPPQALTDLGEGDYFGVRAIEKGYFGGVAQSPIASPRISPTSTVFGSVNGSGSENPSRAASTINSELPPPPQLSRPPSQNTLQQKRAMAKSSPLRPVELRLDEADDSKTRSRDVYVPAAIQENDREQPQPKSPSGFRPTYKTDESKANENKKNLEIDASASNQAYLTVVNPARSIRSQHASIYGASMKSPTVRSPTRSPTFPPGKERTVSLQFGDVPAVPAVPRSPPAVQLRMSGVSNWGEGILEDYDSSRKRVSYYHPSRGALAEESTPPTSTGTSQKDTESSGDSASEQKPLPKPAAHRRKTSAESSKSIKRSQDSLRISRRVSTAPSKAAKRASIERDHVHFDPRNASRTRSGSVQGRKVDFDNPRESPFHHQSNLSGSSYSSTNSSKSSESESPAPRKSITRNRAGSNTSQMSIGDLYDTYYQQGLVPINLANAPQGTPGAAAPSAQAIAQALTAAAANNPDFNPSTHQFNRRVPSANPFRSAGKVINVNAPIPELPSPAPGTPRAI